MASIEQISFLGPTKTVPFAPGYPKIWGSESYKLNFSQRIDCISCSLPSQKLLAVTSGRDIKIYKSRTLELVDTLSGHDNKVNTVKFLDENILASDDGIRSGTVVVWRLDDEGKNLHSSGKILMDVDGLAEAAAGTVLGCIRTKADVDMEWDEQDRTNLITALAPAIASFQRQHLRRQGISFNGLLFRFDSDPWFRAADVELDPNATPSALLMYKTGDRQNLIHVLQLAPGQIEGRETAPELTKGGLKTYQPALGDQATDHVIWTGLSPNGKMLATVSWDQHARIYAAPSPLTRTSDSAPFKLLYKIGPTGGQNWVGAWHPSSEYFAFSQGSPRTIVYVYRVPLLNQSEGKTSQPELLHKLSEFTGWCRSMVWSPDGKKLLCAARNKVLLYNPFIPTIEREFSLVAEPQPSRIECGNAQWISQSRCLWTTGDGAIEMYDCNKELKYRWEPSEGDTSSSGYWSSQIVVANGRMVTSDGDNALRVWDLPA